MTPEQDIGRCRTTLYGDQDGNWAVLYTPGGSRTPDEIEGFQPDGKPTALVTLGTPATLLRRIIERARAATYTYPHGMSLTRKPPIQQAIANLLHMQQSSISKTVVDGAPLPSPSRSYAHLVWVSLHPDQVITEAQRLISARPKPWQRGDDRGYPASPATGT